MPTAYSYLRFSSPKQMTGDSIRRQTEARERWLAAHPAARLDTSLVLEDKGRSAFRRTNWDTYALARFVECVKSGRVEPGSYLLVENLDRLSREDAGEATELFLGLVNKGVVVVQLSPEVTEFRKPVDMLNLMRAILELSRGHSESAIKSERCRAAWKRKNEQAGENVVTKKLPGWVRKTEGGRLVLDKAAAATVRRAFALARDGYSTTAIARLFNAERVPVLGRKVVKGRPVAWAAPTLYQILTSRAAVGEYVPYKWTRRPDKPAGEPIAGYYPAVVSEDEYHVVRAALATRSKVGRGRRGKHINLFAGLLVDARDGGSLFYSNRSDGCQLLPVSTVHGGGAGWASFSAPAFEQAILSKLSEVTAADVQGKGDAAGNKVESLAGEHAAAEQKVKWFQGRCDGAKSPEDFELFAGKAVEWEQKRKALAAKLAAAQRDAASPIAESWGEFRSLADLLAADNTDELRVRVRAALRRAVDGVYCVFVGRRTRFAAVRVQFKGDIHRDYLIAYHPGRSNQNVKRAASWQVRSFAESTLPGDLDLRDPADAAEVLSLLSKLYPEKPINK